MSQTSFATECDRLSHIVDGALFERLRWDRTEGPMLARLVELAHGALDDRSEFELAEEGATSEIKRFVLKVHGNRVIAIAIRLDGDRAVLTAEPIDRSRYTVRAGPPLSAEFTAVDEPWMAAALQDLFGRVQVG